MSRFKQVPPQTPEDWAKIQKLLRPQPNGCVEAESFEWGHGGYPGIVLSNGTGNYRLSRVMFAWAYGDLEQDIHHKCDNPRCVNPEHLAPGAGNRHHRGANPDECAHGHPFSAENTYVNPRGERQCRTCLREASSRYAASNRERLNAKRRAGRMRVEHEPRECGARDCGKVFTPQRSTADFCSSACYQRERRLRLMESPAIRQGEYDAV